MSVATPIEDGLSEMGEAALAYARHGLWVFPVHTPVGGKCSCRKPDCSNVGKHPRTQHGLSDATTDEDTVRRWWGMWPQANIGISCGPSRIVAIDVDPRHGGEESYRDLVQTHGRALVDTVSALTGGGGEHYLFLMPQGARIGNVSNSDKFTGPLGPGVDVRGAGGYIVAAPSTHESGGKYEWWADNGPFDRPMALLPRPLIDLLDNAAPEAPHPRLDTESILGGVPEGQRDWRLFQLAAKLRAADVPRDWAEQLVTAAAASCIPPFPYADALAKVESAYRRYVPEKAAYADPDSILPEEKPGLRDLRVMLGAEILAGLPEPEFLIDRLVVRGATHVLYGEPEHGKTIILLRWILEVVTHEEHVLLIDEESGLNSLGLRLQAMGADPAALDTYLHYYPFPGLDWKGYPELLEVCDELQPALIAMDALSDMLAAAGVEENDGGQVTKWMDTVAQKLSRRPYQPAVVLIDHLAKDALNTKYSVGSRAKKAKADVAWMVQRQTEFDVTTTATVTLFLNKNRPGKMPKAFSYTVGGRDGKLVCEPLDVLQDEISGRGPGQAAVLEFLRQESPRRVSSAEIQGATGLGHSMVWTHLSALKKDGLADQTGAGRSISYAYSGIEAIRPVDANLHPVDETLEEDLRPVRGVPPFRGGPVLDANSQGGRNGIEEDDIGWD